MTVGEVLRTSVHRLEEAGVPLARVEAERLLAWVLRTDRGGVVARGPDPASTELVSRFERLVERRSRREPFQYLTGEETFRDLRFRVDRRVLVPRPETEEVVEAVLGLRMSHRARAVDAGTGSGCIAVSLAVKRPGWRLVALDRSVDALEVARMNARRHGCEARIDFVRADLGELGCLGLGPVDCVVSNPPYVGADEWPGLDPEVRDHEPRDALVAGPTGLEAYRVLGPAAAEVLTGGGHLVLELGWRSEAGARRAVEEAGFEVTEVRPDMRGIARVMLARKDGGGAE